jgi:hypothetical protein
MHVIQILLDSLWVLKIFMILAAWTVGEEKRGFHFALSNIMMQHPYNKNMDVFLSESFAPTYILSLSLTYIVIPLFKPPGKEYGGG